jgi:hypothetical protein
MGLAFGSRLLAFDGPELEVLEGWALAFSVLAAWKRLKTER